MHVRLTDGYVIKRDNWIDRNVTINNSFAHDLPMNLAVCRHIDDQIAFNFGLAAQPPISRHIALFGIAQFDSGRFAEVGCGRCNPVFGEFAFADQNLTAATHTIATANTVDVNSELPCRL